jgi:hypothetical protein
VRNSPKPAERLPYRLPSSSSSFSRTFPFFGCFHIASIGSTSSVRLPARVIGVRLPPPEHDELLTR